MKHFLLLFFCLLAPLSGLADENDDLAKEVAGLHGDLEKAVKQIQDKTAGLEGGTVGAARTRIMQLASDDRFTKAAQDLWAHPKRNTLLIAQGIFFVVMFLLKAWRQSAAKNWFKKILVGMFLGLATWLGLIVVLPYAILGEPYRYFMLTLWRVFVSG